MEKVIQGTLFPEFEEEQKPQIDRVERHRSVKELEKKIAELENENQNLKAENENLKEKAKAFEELSNSPSLFTMTTIGQTFGKSAKWMNNYLADKGVQYNNGEVWVLYAQYKGKGYAKTLYYKYGETQTGKARENPHTYWTGAGVVFIRSLLKKDGLI